MCRLTDLLQPSFILTYLRRVRLLWWRGAVVSGVQGFLTTRARLQQAHGTSVAGYDHHAYRFISISTTYFCSCFCFTLQPKDQVDFT